jgi:hypothetical protein
LDLLKRTAPASAGSKKGSKGEGEGAEWFRALSASYEKGKGKAAAGEGGKESPLDLSMKALSKVALEDENLVAKVVKNVSSTYLSNYTCLDGFRKVGYIRYLHVSSFSPPD